MQPFDWDDLKRELDLWGEAGRVAELWWRDDDATEPTPALAGCFDLADAHALEIGLAVIPAGARDSLAATLAGRPHVAVLQHGYSHTNHAPAGQPAVEVGGARPVDAVLEEMREGYALLAALMPRISSRCSPRRGTISIRRCLSGSARPASSAPPPTGRARRWRARTGLSSPTRISIRSTGRPAAASRAWARR